MSDKMVHWDALKATDPKYTKKVTFGRQFTSINSQWQLQRMTEQFGPIGLGWGYEVCHGIERITDEYVLAVADVRIWWRSDKADQGYGPVRGMSPIVEKGKNGLHFDDDAGKKAMTDALTKGLSHLGLSADVFLGLFDDNKYVQSLREQFPPNMAAEARLLNAEEGRDHLPEATRQNTTQGLAPKAPTKNDTAVQAKTWTDAAIGQIEMIRAGREIDAWFEANSRALEKLETVHPDQFKRIEAAATKHRDDIGARLQ